MAIKTVKNFYDVFKGVYDWATGTVTTYFPKVLLFGSDDSGTNKRLLKSKADGTLETNDAAVLTAVGATNGTAVTDPTATGTLNQLFKGFLKQLQGTGTGSLPVSLSDKKVSAIHTFHDTATSGGVGTALNASGYSTLSVAIDGTATSHSITFLGIVPNGTYQPIAGVRKHDFSIATGTTSKYETWDFDVTGLGNVVMNIASIAGGNITAKGRLTA